mmetsp:Transcript_20862/g.45427  ORF Transcript_20862/g.45427 Transcript_20862/m.45427 type:complete len:655 (+) Transcript_20862:176-2140(+)
MSNLKMSSPPEQIARTIDPVNMERLELGKKVFKVPVPSRRRSTRNKDNYGWKKPSNKIRHNLLLGPTLKRRRKKKLEREKENNNDDRRRTRTRATTDSKHFSPSENEKDIQLSDIFANKTRSNSKQRLCLKRNNQTNSCIRRLARCAGVKRVHGLNTHNDQLETRGGESILPPPFEPKSDDPFILPQPGQLVSYLWYTRPNPVYGRKQIYRTGVLCSNNGKIRFFDSESEQDMESSVDGERKFFESKFHLNKRVFDIGNFRVRTDLVKGAISYEREMKLPCKIVQIDEMSGAVLVESLLVQGKGKKTLWISPDDLVGNYKLPRTRHERKSRSEKNCNINKDSVGSSEIYQTTIDLTEENECQSYSISSQPSMAPKVPSNPHLIPNAEAIRPSPNPSSAMPASWYMSMGIAKPLSKVHHVGSTTTLGGGNFTHQKVRNSIIANGMLGQSSLRGGVQSLNLPIEDSSRLPVGRMISGCLGASVRGQSPSDTFATINRNATIQLGLNLIKQHGAILTVLNSSSDLATIMVCLQHVKRIHQRGIPVGPTGKEIVSEAELKSQLLIQDMFLKHLTAPKYTGGRGYSLTYARVMFCQVAPILGSNFGSLDKSLINVIDLLRLGLSDLEASDIFPFIQTLEEDILLKSISLRRQLEPAHRY